MFVPVVAGLLQKDDLIDARFLQGAQVAAHVVRRADTGATGALAGGLCDEVFRTIAAGARELAPQIRAPRNRIARYERVQRIAEKFETVLPAANGFGAIRMD